MHIFSSPRPILGVGGLCCTPGDNVSVKIWLRFLLQILYLNYSTKFAWIKHLGLFMDLKDLDTESGLWILDAEGGSGVWSRLKFMGQIHFDDNIWVITGPNFTKLAWMVHHMILMHFTCLDAESEPKVLDAECD